MHRPSRTSMLAAFATIYLLWGSTYLAIRFGVETIPPFLAAGVRSSFGGAGFVAWALLRGKGTAAPVQLRSAVITGLLLVAGGEPPPGRRLSL